MSFRETHKNNLKNQPCITKNNFMNTLVEIHFKRRSMGCVFFKHNWVKDAHNFKIKIPKTELGLGI